MSRTQLLFCLFGLSATFFVNTAEARLPAEGIIGGENAKEGDYPYQVSLEMKGQSICGGSIYADRFVITAAHCVLDEEGQFFGKPMKVIAGVTDLNVWSKNRVVVDVAQIFVLKEFDITDMFSRSTADIAVLKLKKDLGISSNPNLGKVELPEEDKTYAGVNATVSGFGWNKVDVVKHPLYGPREIGGTSFDKMRYANANVLTNVACQKVYPDTISPKHLCAGVAQRNPRTYEGVCSGDSGGPLVYEGTLIGVVSTSPLGCREDYQPAVYTRVSKYVDFVKNVVSGEINSEIRSITLRSSIFS